MDNITVWIIIGNVGIILVLLYLIRLSVLRGRDGSDKKSLKQTRSSTSLRKIQDELPSEKDRVSSGLDENKLQNVEDGKVEYETWRTDTSLRQRTVRLSKTPTNETATGDPQNKEFGLIQEELIKPALVDEVEQSVNEEFGGGSTEKANFTAGAASKAVAESSGGAIQREQSLQQLSRFAESFTSSVVQEAVGEIIDEENKEKFVNNLAKDILDGGLQEVVAVVNTNKQEQLKLCEYGEFSEQCSSKILADGIRLAAAHKHNSSVQELLVENSVKEGIEIASAAHQQAETLTSTVCKSALEEATLSTALKPHIRGVVQNLVNEAIYEAVLRVGAADEPSRKSSTEDYSSDVVCTTALESHVEDTIQELISSAIDAVNSNKDQVLTVDDKLTDKRLNNAEDYVGLKVNDTVPCPTGSDYKMAGENVQESPLLTPSLSNVMEKSSNDINANMNHLEHCIEADPVVPEIVSPVELVAEDIVPDKNGHADHQGSLDVQRRDKKQNSPTGFWRRSLIEDLENDMDLDESFTGSTTSEKSELESPKFDLDSPTLPNESAPAASDESSDEEFFDSSEDEIIDHAEEATMGAVGGSRQHAASDDDEDDGDSDDFSDSDEDEGFEPFETHLTVDGLCMSVPKGKHKYKGKSKHVSGKHKPKPRHRIKSAGKHFNNAVIIDNGCGVLKAGFAGERKPRVVEPAVIGIPKRYSLQMTGMNGKKDRKYGSAATNAAGVLHLDYPMKPGMIDSWTDIEDMWEFMLYSMLGVSEGDHPVVLTEVAHNPVRNREKIAEILFEHLSVPAMYLADQLSLALYASGMTTGVSVSSGFSVTEAAVVYEGHTLPHTAQQLDIAGQQLTENLRLLLRDNKGLKFVSSSEWQLVNTMKETLAYVAQDYSEEFNKYQTGTTDPKYFTLPDGQMVEISSELISSVEPLFEPESLVFANDTVASQQPLPKMVTEAINRCDVDLQDICYRSIVLSGGTTMLSGIVPRLQREVQKLNPKVRKIRAPDERSIASWVGGSILASLSTFENQYITIDEYADSGPSIVRRKCF